MTRVRAAPERSLKSATGIVGFDEVTGGGLPRGRTTLLLGGPGSGKTIFALEFLVHGALHCKEPGIFVAFEEVSKRIVANASSFGWKLSELQKRRLFFLDAQPVSGLVQSGDFDLSGMLAALEAKIHSMKAQRIVFDALDVMLALLPDAAAKRREVYRLHEWLLKRELTGLITAKTGGDEASSMGQKPFGFMQFMVDCAVMLNHDVVQGVSQRTLRVQKYRGSGFGENESPFLIGASGLEVDATRALANRRGAVSSARLSTGIERLDTMLGGGYYRGANVLITGFSGTAKTTLAGAFAEAACGRGERTLFVSFDSDANEVVRDLASVNIRLAPHVKCGRLHLISTRTITGSAETYLVHIKSLAAALAIRCLVIDPMSTWSRSANDINARGVAERLTDWAKTKGITLVCTSLVDEMSSAGERDAPMPLSSLADTWIHLSYLMQGGERNRGLSIIKSRGTAHSNQVRELLLSDDKVTLADTYSAGGEVLMGTMRWEKERAEGVAGQLTQVAGTLKRVKLDAEEAELEMRVKALQTELVAKQVEKALLASTAEARASDVSRGQSRLKELRGADAVIPARG